MTKTTTLLLACGLLAGCAVGPDYQRPPLALPDRYAAGPLPALALDATAAAPGVDAPPPQRLVPATDVPAEWWRTFHSPAIDEWVGAALAHNPNVEAAEAALRVARENTEAERGGFWPSVALNFQPTRQKVSQDVASPVANNATLFNLHTAQVTVSYAPDVFGATRRSVEAANAQSEQQRFQLEASKLALSSNVVVAAINEASLRAQRAATREIIDEQTAVLRGYQRQQALGQVSAADVDAQVANLAASEATLPPLDKQLATQRNQLLAMAGRYPADDSPLHFELDALELPAELPLVLPASLVEHRPDVKAAEAQLQAASAGIGVAVAARLPNVLLGVNAYGSSAYSLGQLFTSSTTFWTLAANVTQPLIDGGTLKHREAAARATFDQSAAQYRATVLQAFQDVANALQALDADAAILRTATTADRTAARSLQRSRDQLRLGDGSALAVLQAQQAAQQARLNLVQARAARLSDTAALFLALGGGWWHADGTDAVATAPAAGVPH